MSRHPSQFFPDPVRCPSRLRTGVARWGLLLSGLLSAFGACDSAAGPEDTLDDQVPEDPVLSVSPLGITITGVGSSAQFTVRTLIDGEVIYPEAQWTSLDPSIATVDPLTGKATAVASGQVPIRAEWKGAVGYGLATVSIPQTGEITDWIMESGPNPDLLAIWGSSADDIHVVGEGGTYLHFDGSTWTQIETDFTRRIRGIWGAGDGQVFAVGDLRTVFRMSGSGWEKMEGDVNGHYLAVWGRSSSDVFAGGDGGRMVHSDGMGWTDFPSGTEEPIKGIWGTSDLLFTATEHGVHRLVDGVWSQILQAPEERLYGIWGTSESNIYAFGNHGVLRFDGTGWARVYDANGVYGMWGTGPADVYGAGSSCVLRFDGSTWTDFSEATPGYHYGGWGSSATNLYVVGSGNTLLHYDGSSWTALRAQGPGDHLLSVWGSPSGQVTVVGEDGAVLKNADWRGSVSSSNLNGVWGASPQDIIAVGSSGTLRRSNGSRWFDMPSPGTLSWESVWGSAPNSVFAIGRVNSQTGGSPLSGRLFRYDGEEWSRVGATPGTLYDIWGTSSENIFITGVWGDVFRYDGHTLTETRIPGAPHLYGIWGTSPNHVVAVGRDGTILSFDGTSWTAMDSGTDRHLFAVTGTSPNDLFAVGNGIVLHFDGTEWRSLDVPLNRGISLMDAWISSDSDLWAVGAFGTVVRGVR